MTSCLQFWCTLEAAVRGKAGTGRGSSAPAWPAKLVIWSCCSSWCLSTLLNFLSRPREHCLSGDSDRCAQAKKWTHWNLYYFSGIMQYFFVQDKLCKHLLMIALSHNIHYEVLSSLGGCCVSETCNQSHVSLTRHTGSCLRIIIVCPVLEAKPLWLRWLPHSQMPVKGSLASWRQGSSGFSRMMRSKVTSPSLALSDV